MTEILKAHKSNSGSPKVPTVHSQVEDRDRAGVLVFRSGILSPWLGWLSILAAPVLVLQTFGLGGVVASFGLVLDLIGFVLFLFFVLVSSVILLRRENAVRNTAARIG